jgi:hypothetical protein
MDFADFEALIDAASETLFNPPGHLMLGGERVSYALFDAAVCDAAANDIASIDVSFRRGTLEKLSLEELGALALGQPLDDLARAILSLVETEPGVRDALIGFAQLAEWVRRFGAWHPAKSVGQLDWAEELARIDDARRNLSVHAHMRGALERIRTELIADWRAETPELEELSPIAGDRAGWRPRNPEEPPIITTHAELEQKLVASGGNAATARELVSAIPNEKLRGVVSLLEAELSEATAEIVAEMDGVVRIESRGSEDLRQFLAAVEPDAPELGSSIVIEGQWGEKRSLLPVGRNPAVVSGQRVEAGAVLSEGRTNIHARLRVLGGQAALATLVAELKRMLGDATPEGLGDLLTPLVGGFVRVVETSDSTFERGQIVGVEAFVAECERVTASGKRAPIATSVFVGLSEARF